MALSKAKDVERIKAKDVEGIIGTQVGSEIFFHLYVSFPSFLKVHVSACPCHVMSKPRIGVSVSKVKCHRVSKCNY